MFQEPGEEVILKCVLCLEAGKVFTWGRADYGQLGRHTAVPGGQQSTASEQCLELLCNTPVSVPCLNGASQVKKKITLLRPSLFFFCALK